MEFIKTVAPYVLAVLATSTVATLITLWVQRKNRDAERRKIEAETSKAHAEAAKIDGEVKAKPIIEQRAMVESLSTFSESVVSLLEKLETKSKENQTLIAQNGELQRSVDQCERREALLQAAIKEMDKKRGALASEVHDMQSRLTEIETLLHQNGHTLPPA